MANSDSQSKKGAIVPFKEPEVPYPYGYTIKPTIWALVYPTFCFLVIMSVFLWLPAVDYRSAAIPTLFWGGFLALLPSKLQYKVSETVTLKLAYCMMGPFLVNMARVMWYSTSKLEIVIGLTVIWALWWWFVYVNWKGITYILPRKGDLEIEKAKFATLGGLNQLESFTFKRIYAKQYLLFFVNLFKKSKQDQVGYVFVQVKKANSTKIETYVLRAVKDYIKIAKATHRNMSESAPKSRISL